MKTGKRTDKIYEEHVLNNFVDIFDKNNHGKERIWQIKWKVQRNPHAQRYVCNWQLIYPRKPHSTFIRNAQNIYIDNKYNEKTEIELKIGNLDVTVKNLQKMIAILSWPLPTHQRFPFTRLSIR